MSNSFQNESRQNSGQLSRLEKDLLAAKYSYVATRDKKTHEDLPDGMVNLDDIMRLQANGIKYLGMSDFVLDEKENPSKLRTVIFLNDKTKEITVAIAGTRMGFGADKLTIDLKDDARLAVGLLPTKIDAANKINEILIKDLTKNGIDKSEISKYKFNFTGHSLGAVMADCAAADMTMRLQHDHNIDVGKGQISTVTFDNPGAKTLVQNICAEYKRKYTTEDIDIDKLKEVTSFKAINNRPNFINTLDEQVGEKFTIVPPGQKPLSSFRLMCGYVSEKCKRIPVIGQIMNLLSMGSIKSQLNSHFLDNFEQVIVQPDGVEGRSAGRLQSKYGKEVSLEEAITGMEPIKYDAKVFGAIKNIRTTGNGGDIPGKYSMTNPETKERVVCSPNQLTSAVDNISKLEEYNNIPTPASEKPKKRFTDMFKSKNKNEEFHIKDASEVVNSNNMNIISR